MMKETRCLLLVEGTDDLHVFSHLFENHDIPERFRIVNSGGVNALLESLPVQLKASELEILGVVIDADESLEQRWDQIRSILHKSGYCDISKLVDPHGLVLKQPEKPTVGVWLMPNNETSGMLENFVEFLVPVDDHLWPRAQSCVDSIPDELRRFSINRTIKAEIHTWLAWQEEPGTPMGLAIAKRYLDHDVPVVHDFLAWIRRLFFS